MTSAHRTSNAETSHDPRKSTLDLTIASSLHELTVDLDGRRFRGTMLFPESLTGPPGRVHGGVHPIARTLPILERLRPGDPSLGRLRMDAALQMGLPIGTTVPFEGTYESTNDGFVLETRFLDSDRLRARATPLASGPLLDEAALARWRSLFEHALEEPRSSAQIVGVEYASTDSAVWLDLRALDELRERAHVRAALSDIGGLGMAGFSTQLDAVGVLTRAERLRHPHFTKHLDIAFDLDGVTRETPILVVGDRTTIVELANSATVDIRGTPVGTARIEAVAVDATFTRCFAHAVVTAHPVDPARFAGFEEIRKLRDPI